MKRLPILFTLIAATLLPAEEKPLPLDAFMQQVRHGVNKIVRGRDGTPTYVYVSEQ